MLGRGKKVVGPNYSGSDMVRTYLVPVVGSDASGPTFPIPELGIPPGQSTSTPSVC